MRGDIFVINRKIKILCFLVVFLVASITPASATMLGQTDITLLQNNEQKDELKQTIGNYQNQIDQLTLELKNDSDNLNLKAEEIKNTPKWRIFRIIKKAYELKDMANNLIDKTNNLETLTKNLESTQSQLDNIEGNENSIISDPSLNAQNMANKLQSSLNAPFEVNACNGTLMIGDLVLYKTNNGYYRYLRVNNITENNFILEGKDKQLISVSKDQIGKILYVLKTGMASDSYNGAEAAYNIQKDQINLQLEESSDKSELAASFRIVSSLLYRTGTSVGAIAGIVGVIGLILFFNLPTFTAGVVVLGCSVVLGIIATSIAGVGLILEHLANKYDAQAKKLEDTANNNLADLNSFMSSTIHIPVANNMALNTTVNKTLECVFNASDADNDILNASVVAEPKQGNLTINGTKFVYTPANDYIGNDTFTYNVKDSMGLISNIATVNIQVENKTENNTTITFNKTNLSSKDNETIIKILSTLFNRAMN